VLLEAGRAYYGRSLKRDWTWHGTLQSFSHVGTRMPISIRWKESQACRSVLFISDCTNADDSIDASRAAEQIALTVFRSSQ